jgi:hypothetical protein
MDLWRRRGITSSLSHVEAREHELVSDIESALDAGRLTGGLLREIVTEARARSRRFPGDASWPFLLGRCLMAIGEPVEARERLEAAALVSPRDPRISAHLALWYAAAYFAASGDYANLEMPPGAGPEITVDVRAFNGIDEPLSPAALASRVTQYVDATLRFSLRARDAQMLKRHRASVALAHIDAVPSEPPTLIPLSRAG